MPVEVVLPKLGLTMTQGTIRHWFKAEGDSIENEEPLFEFETDKAVMEVKAPRTGVLGKILAPVGATVPVAQVVALILEPGEEMPEEALPEKPKPSAVPAPPVVKGSPEPPAAPPLTPPATRVEGREVRHVRAQRMAKSLQTTAQVTLTIEVDSTELLKWHAQWEEEVERSLGFSISFKGMLVKIVAMALREHPQVNAMLTEEGIQLLTSINVGMAVDTERGLLVPVIHEADSKDIFQIARDLQELVERAQAGESLPDDLSDGTFTILELGLYQIEAFTPIINLPECAILGVGRILAKPVVYQGEIDVRQMMYLSLSFDHRLIDGAPAARFLQHVKHLIEKPYLILLACDWQGD